MNKIKDILFTKPLYLIISTSLFLNFIIEALSRSGIIDSFIYLVNEPLVFLYNSFIIFFTLSFIFWFKRRVFYYTAITSMWLTFGIANGVLLSKRVTPFTAIDLYLIKSGIAVMPSYMSPIQIVLIFLAAALIIGIIFLIYFIAPKTSDKINFKKNLVGTLTVSLCMVLFTSFGLKTDLLASYFSNIAFAYEDYGFPYCFTNTLLNTGISESSTYSPETINEISKQYSLSNSSTNSKPLENNKDSEVSNEPIYPNVIMVQLESFFDITTIKNLSFSEDPIPNFRKLKESFSSGYLSVPTIGAGTANTEFEVLTGMSLDFFGAGEYPYKTILQDTTTESIAYNLKAMNYSTHALHNNIGVFYDRNLIFSHLGFDTFISSEFMNITEETPTGWAKDSVLLPEIIGCLDSSENNDLVYTITVEGHGEYPEEEILVNPQITVEGTETEEKKNALTYYTNLLYEADKFVANLIDEISKRDEKTVIVFFGDHLPTLGFEDEDINGSNVFQTQYLIWDNFNLPKSDKDLEAYQLTSSVLERLNINTGVLNRYHNQATNDLNYKENLEMLQFDMLYGENYIFNGTNPFISTNIKMGLNDITIDNVYMDDGQVVIKGNNFREISYVFINNKKQDTTFIDSNTLVLPDTTLDELDTIIVKQIAKEHTIYSVTNEYIYK